jgi:DNA-binding SARP family transcriptional activator/Tfp pilus assembly protein PilF
MKFRILGPIEVWHGSGWRPVPAAKQRALLALLLLRPCQVLERDWLIETLWNGNAPTSAVRLLPHYVWRLRELLPDGSRTLRTVQSGYLLDIDAGTVDSQRFTALVAEAGEATAGQPDRAVERLTVALRMWRGPALLGAPPLPVIAAAAGRLDQLRLDARESLAEAQLRGDRPLVALAGLEELTAEEPYRERAWRLLMLALYRVGRRPDALAAYRRLWRIWTDQLGVEPGQDLRELHRRVLDDDPSLAREEPPPAGAVRAAPAPGTSPLPRPAQLPADPPSFTGRVAELERLLALFPDPERVPSAVVISAIGGMAGVGKTALAVRAAHRLAPHFPDGQLFIDLHGYTEAVAPVEPGEALERMLRALGVSGDQIPAHLEDRAGLWRSLLATRRVLIVLDNAATEAQVQPLLPGSPGCLVLVTSRARLAGLEGVRPLSLDVMSPTEALAMFRESVGGHDLAHQPSGALAEIVELCGRLPLAIRVAAARLTSHPTWEVAQFATRLRDHQRRLGELAAGQRSVTAALDLSYDHLAPPLRRMYRLCGLHPGADYDPHAAAVLAGTTAPDAERMLECLTDVHLLSEPAPGRYRFHDLARAHAAQTTVREDTEPERRDALTRLLDHYLHTAATAMDTVYPHHGDERPDLPAPAGGPAVADPPRAAAWLDAELGNLLAAARFAADAAGAAGAASAAGAAGAAGAASAAGVAGGGWARRARDLSTTLGRHLYVRGYYTDAEALHAQALAVAGSHGDRRGELDALTALGYVRRLLGRHERAVDCFTRALEIARDTGHRAGEVAAHNGLGHAHRAQARYGPAVTSFERALAIARDIGHRRGEQVALQGLGFVHLTLGRYQQAADYSERALAIARGIGYRGGELIALSGLGFVNRALGRYRRGGGYFRLALRLAHTEGHRAAEVHALWGLGQINYTVGRYGPAMECFEGALAVARDIGDRNGQFEGLHGRGLTRCALGHPGQALADHRAAHQLATELGHPVDRARALHGLAGAHRQLGQREQARRCWQEALDILEGVGVTKVEEVRTEDIRANLAQLAGKVPAGPVGT